MVMTAEREQLTRMQKAVLHLAIQGKTNEQIGLELGIAINTVDAHMQGCKRRLGLDDGGTRWLVRAAYALGIAKGRTQ